ncbi:alpha/beta hydrolase [Virgisporangium ochraceum]|uniref:Alpha/beta hydrolase n=1 Tax=Virgisporangium ochraceum TaxID=65505 RepID=A0A8J4A451_9ACTN|nr:alpha/beta hydrolase [Virgisporangium ochraceum]GIJ73530.1 alpha/beta hydrolase [Virgisporangium ochraceum]
MRRHALPATLAALLLVTLMPQPTPAAAAAGGPRPTWGQCPPSRQGVPLDPRMRCTTVRVPLDYRAPRGPGIDIVVSSIRTAKPGLRRGVLVMNPGGPGDLSLEMPSMFGPLLPADVLDRYDLIGFDPRGVGSSAPISCHVPTDIPPDVFDYPDPDGSIDRTIAAVREAAAGCVSHVGDALPHITTANTARDIDRIRAVLGEERISYLGYSYGSWLGTIYRALFPGRADRFVLDSAIDPARQGYEQKRLLGPAVELRLPDFTGWVAARDATYGLGATPAAVRATYDSLTRRLDATPVTLPDGTVVNGNTLRGYTHFQLYRDSNFPTLAGTWQFLAATGAAQRTAAWPDIPADNQGSVIAVIGCNDVAWPRDLDVYRRNVAVDRRLFPATAGQPSNVNACAFWPHRPAETVRVTPGGRRNVLIVQNLRDPATPWVGALGLLRALGSAAGMVSIDQGGHGAYLLTNSRCGNDTVTAFLAHGVLPATPRLCPGQPLPA